MKVTLKDKDIMSYVLSVNVEVEGEEYSADISYSYSDGYEVTFLDREARKEIGYPQWAKDYVEDNPTGDSLGYWLESEIGGWFQWEPSKEEASA
jgi:hypothetical protein